MPTRGKGKEELLYLVPNLNTMFLKNKLSSIHAAQYAKAELLDVHVDSQNPHDHPDVKDAFD